MINTVDDGQHRLRDDRGAVGGVEVVPFGMLIFVIGSLLVANAWAVVDAKFMVTSAAREAARAYVEAPDPTAASSDARRAASDAVRSYGRDPAKASIRVDHENGRAWGRCVRVAATVHYPVPVVVLPWVGGFGHAFDAVSVQSEIIDPFRAGLPDVAAC